MRSEAECNALRSWAGLRILCNGYRAEVPSKGRDKQFFVKNIPVESF